MKVESTKGFTAEIHYENDKIVRAIDSNGMDETYKYVDGNLSYKNINGDEYFFDVNRNLIYRKKPNGEECHYKYDYNRLVYSNVDRTESWYDYDLNGNRTYFKSIHYYADDEPLIHEEFIHYNENNDIVHYKSAYKEYWKTYNGNDLIHTKFDNGEEFYYTYETTEEKL